jgi:hypothetical protein
VVGRCWSLVVVVMDSENWGYCHNFSVELIANPKTNPKDSRLLNSRQFTFCLVNSVCGTLRTVAIGAAKLKHVRRVK